MSRKIQEIAHKFALERDWEQFHTPKNLASALSVEASELLEIFQWMSADQSMAMKDKSHGKREAVEHEMADIYIYLLRLCEVLDIDLEAAALRKMKLNEIKYPVARCKGKSNKYNDL